MSDASTAPPILGERYHLTRRIARGGMADIYAAWDETLDRTVAIKVLFPHFAADPTFVARFKREARSAGSLAHPNVVAVYDWGAYEDTYYIVMELIEGESLAEVLRDEGPLSPEQAVYVTREVAAALGFAHSHGTVHRDIKPGNIMLTAQGQVKVADFGIARAYDGHDDDLTQTGHVMGTAAYFSPEQAQGHPIDQRSDLYSLGVVLFEMLTGDKPFTGTSPVSVAYKHVELPPPRVSSVRPGIARDVDEVVDILLAKRPEQRYPDASALVADLDRIRAGEPMLGVANHHTGMTNGYVADATHALATADAGPALVHPGYTDTSATRAMAHGPGTMVAPMSDPYGMGPDSGGGPAMYDDPPSRTGLFAVILGALVLLAVALVVVISQLGGGDDDTAEETAEMGVVPTVVGQTQESATTRLEEDGFTVKVEFDDSGEGEPGLVTSQDPAGQTELALGEPVTIVVASAGETETVTDVTGKPVEEAEAELRALGFAVTIERVPDDEVEEDLVISQSIEGGQDAPIGTEIILTVSAGASDVPVPSVTGMTEEEAVATLTGFGFQVVREYVEVGPDSSDAGRVIDQSPGTDESVPPDTAITLTIGRAAAQTTTTQAVTTTPEPETTTTRPATTTTTRPATTTTEEPEPTTTTSVAEE